MGDGTETALTVLLAALRMRAGLTRRALSLRAGLDASYLHRVEQGIRTPDRAHLLLLARALDLDDAETDGLLVAGGFAPVHLASLLAAPELAELNDLMVASPPKLREVLEGLVIAAVSYGRQAYARSLGR